MKPIFYKGNDCESFHFEPISIIIAARNEAGNLSKNLKSVLEQNYKEFEVIVVNDGSTDNSAEILNTFQKIYSNLKVVHINNDTRKSAGKKGALTIGIKEAKNDLLVFLDADCYPISFNWLYHIAMSYKPNTGIVLGYGAYEKRRGFLNKMIRFETITIALKYMSFALAGIPYMGVGRNLSYRKSLFIKNGGFNSHKSILSGDDDLFVNEASDKKNTKVVLNRESVTFSVPELSFKKYILQKRRHLKTGKYYKRSHQFLLASEQLSLLFFYLFGLFLLFAGNHGIFVLLIYLVRLSVMFVITGLFSKSLKEKNILFFIPIFDFLIPTIILYIVIRNSFYKDIEIPWK